MRASVAQPSAVAHVLLTSLRRKEPAAAALQGRHEGLVLASYPGWAAGCGGVNSGAAELLCKGRGPINTFLGS